MCCSCFQVAIHSDGYAQHASDICHLVATTKAGGTHLIGMHSCLQSDFCFSKILSKFTVAFNLLYGKFKFNF